MSIELRNITKVYGEQKAVNDVSFSVKKGEIVGFLGPNGAGKTTTMKILTTYIPSTSGEALVCDYDVNAQAEEVRKCIGYLPEHNPLYKDMYVLEYLRFVAGLHKIKNPKHRIEALVEQTGLSLEVHKKIGALSKGYRQRVGLAQAMIHDPAVLILDEPTTGLDPNQLLDIRNLIRTLGKEKTVLFSSHIMQEVQAICDRVVIINKGNIVANDSIDVLTQIEQKEALIKVAFLKDIDQENLLKIKGVKKIKSRNGKGLELICEQGNKVKEEIFNFAVQQNNPLIEMKSEEQSIEDVFQKLTQENA